MEYYEGVNKGDWYLCDKCNVSKLNWYEFEANIRDEEHFCDECWCYMHIQTHTDDKGNKYTLRSERRIEVWPQ